MTLTTTFVIALLAAEALAHGDHADQAPIAGPHKSLWYNTLPGDGGTQVCQLDDNSIPLVQN
jgi:agmatinase